MQGKKCQRNYDAMIYALSAYPVIPINEYTVEYEGGIFFNHLFAGLGMLSDHCDDQSYHGRNIMVTNDCNQGKCKGAFRKCDGCRYLSGNDDCVS